MGFRKFVRLLAFFMTVAGCDCNKTRAQIEARHVMVATVLATPAFGVPVEGIAGIPWFDGGLPAFDGGIPGFDGGCPFLGGCIIDAGSLPISFSTDGIDVKPQVVLAVFFGTREGDGLASAPVAVTDATVKAQGPTGMWNLSSLGSGAHGKSSSDDATLVYDAGATYTFTATSMMEDYVGDVSDTPAAERVHQLHPDAGYIAITAGSPYQLTRPDPVLGEQRLLGFVTVLPIAADGKQGIVTYSNIPTTPLGFLKLVAAPSEWKETVVTIPGSAFPEPDRNYVILLQSAKLGLATSDNLFIGSAMIAGVADVGVVKTH